jgi:hypothetical protein
MTRLPEGPSDPLQRIAWLRELELLIDQEYDSSYFQARMQQQIQHAIGLGIHSRKSIMHRTRRENERRGRVIRWGDGLR